jgi:hypothetical protein
MTPKARRPAARVGIVALCSLTAIATGSFAACGSEDTGSPGDDASAIQPGLDASYAQAQPDAAQLGLDASSQALPDTGSAAVPPDAGLLPPDAGQQCTPDTWNNYFYTWFSNTCGSCHHHSGSFTSNSTAYSWVTGNSASIVSRIQNGSMPPTGDPNSAADAQRIQKWIDCGAPK